MLVIPSAPQFVQPFKPLRACLLIPAEAARVNPCGVTCAAQLKSDDTSGGVCEKFAVMADIKHALITFDQLVFKPAFAWDVEEVVWFIEKKNLIRTTKERVKYEALLLTAR